MTQAIKAIETIGERGIKYRSRLEAKWARMFELLNWPWQYEPIDLDGYIPDFILTFPNAPILVEVKPATTLADLPQYTRKVQDSWWDREAIIVGASPFMGGDTFDFPILGLFAERDDDGAWDWSDGRLCRCVKCGKSTLYHEDGSWRCRFNGCYDGDRYIGRFNFHSDQYGSLMGRWGQACNLTRWMPGGARIDPILSTAIDTTEAK